MMPIKSNVDPLHFVIRNFFSFNVNIRSNWMDINIDFAINLARAVRACNIARALQ